MTPQQIDRGQTGALQFPLNGLNFLLQTEDNNSKGAIMPLVYLLFCFILVACEILLSWHCRKYYDKKKRKNI